MVYKCYKYAYKIPMLNKRQQATGMMESCDISVVLHILPLVMTDRKNISGNKMENFDGANTHQLLKNSQICARVCSKTLWLEVPDIHCICYNFKGC